MAIFCRLRNHPDVLDALAELGLSFELETIKRRVHNGDLFNIRNEHDRVIIDAVYTPIRSKLKRARGAWVRAESPLRDIVDGEGLKWHGKGKGTRGRERLAHQTLDHHQGDDREAAYEHQWIQAQLVRLGQ